MSGRMRGPLTIASLMVSLVPAQAVPRMTAAEAKVGATAPAAALPAAAATPDRAPPHRPTVIEQAGDSLFYVEARVNGVPVQFVVDTGSSVVLLSSADAARAGVSAKGAVAVDTAGGASPMRRARIDQVVLAGRSMSGVDAIVSGDLKVSLLGQSALSQMGSVTLRDRRLELE